MPTDAPKDDEKAFGTVDDAASPATLQQSGAAPGALPAVEDGLVLERVEGSDWVLLTFSKTPTHASDPLCMSTLRKAWLTLLAALLVMTVRSSLLSLHSFSRTALTHSTRQSALTSSCSSGAAVWIHEDLGGNVRPVASLQLTHAD